MSEFDGAISALFRKTAGLYELPAQQPTKYVVTLFDLKTWSEVDIEVDERLCVKADESALLGCLPSTDAEMWGCYLEKALAIHCGSWDELEGGHCTHAWRMLTGCKHQYTFMNYGEGFECLGTLNPNTGEWEPLDNSPHKGFQGLWPTPWPEVGGGGDIGESVDENDMFEKLCAWDDQNYIIACGTKAGSDSQDTDGIVDGHAYTVLTCINNAGGTDFDMIRVRNPWGKGEFKSGLWTDEGEGWTKYPEVREACKPVVANDGVFWVEKEEFFKYFKTIYLCAQDMSEFITWTNSSNNNNNNAN
uniref:Calpain catalytic domain-containing protein n=1 Tax=Strombidinopsis acuminata TaxID=141414 RepID=A0A7S3U8F0_9SPIT|mmetsp:Transcript_99720/g.137132  ORF Transcript_99720/g.137132 Transcript_99720/m.137132 type:complete len:303 (+) Transcript_99720:167-1075(+)